MAENVRISTSFENFDIWENKKTKTKNNQKKPPKTAYPVCDN